MVQKNPLRIWDLRPYTVIFVILIIVTIRMPGSTASLDSIDDEAPRKSKGSGPLVRIFQWFQSLNQAAARERELYRKEGHYTVADCDPEDAHAMEAADLPLIWVITSPGSPVTALVHRIADSYNFYHLSVGQLLQREITLETGQEDTVHHLFHRGIAIPRSFVFEIIRRQLGNISRKKEHKGVILTDYPTTVSQAQEFYEFIRKPDFILYIKFSDSLTRENIHIYLKFQVRSSKVLQKLQPDIHAVSIEQGKKFKREIERLSKMHSGIFKVIDTSLSVTDVCKDIMKWVERAMVLHGVTPPLFVLPPLQEYRVH